MNKEGTVGLGVKVGLYIEKGQGLWWATDLDWRAANVRGVAQRDPGKVRNTKIRTQLSWHSKQGQSQASLGTNEVVPQTGNIL